MPPPFIKDLGDAVPHETGRSDLESGFLPLAGKTDRIIPAGVVPVDVEEFHGIRKLAVIAVEMEAMLDFLPPERHRFFTLGHPRLDRASDDGVEITEVVDAVGEPGIDDVGLADVLDA